MQEVATKLSYADISPKQAKKLLGNELGTQFDVRDRLFSYWGDGTVFDYSSWSEADMKQMILRDGQAAALEAVLTLPIRQCPWSIVPSHGDKGEAEFVRSVLMQPPMSGGMRTPMQQVIGQATAAQIYKKAYFLPCREGIHNPAGRRTDCVRQGCIPASIDLPGSP